MNTLSKKLSKKESNKSKDNSGSSKVRKVLSKISGAFMLPISIMAIAGLFLGVGATISHQAVNNQGLKVFGEFIKMLGEPVFAALPLLFASAFVVAFTDEAGVGVFATIIAYLTFSALQSVFIWESYTSLMHNGTPVPAQIYDENLGKFVDLLDKEGKIIPEKTLEGYVILFKQGGRDAASMEKLVGSTLGFKSLQTSAFGGIAVGLIVQYLYNRFHTIQLPSVISFFGGKRFVAIISIIAMIPTAFIFLLLWPWIGKGLSTFGNYLGKVPYGFESFIFGFLERSLVPFGLHHAFYAPLWYTQAGGDLYTALNNFKTSGLVPGESLNDLIKTVAESKNKFVGDSTMSLSLVGFKYNTIEYTLNGTAVSKPLFAFLAQDLGIKVGRFLDGKFSFMIFGLPAAGLAMIMAAPKENRKLAIGAVLPAAITCLVTGVTEPIEFTFLFLAPWLFWGFHAFFCALSFMIANLLGVHIPMAFSGGLLDLTIYGIIPFAKGTNFYWTLAVGAGYAPIYFFAFLFFIKKFNLETPGRGRNVKLFTKEDYLKQKDTKGTTQDLGQIDPKGLAVVQAYGGISNITSFNNCASRLRYDVLDGSLVNEDALKAAGAAGVKREGNNHVQAIFGPVSEQLNSKIKSQRDLISQWELSNKLTPEVKEGQIIQTVKTVEVVETVTTVNSNELQDQKIVKTVTITEPIVSEKTTIEKLNDENVIVETIKTVEEKPAAISVEKEKTILNTDEVVSLQSPACGKVKSLESLHDGVFSEKMVGEGFVVAFSAKKEARIYSPVDGKISMVYDTKHAYGITTNSGINLLLHIGIDTVKLNGQGFTSFVKVNKKVSAGDVIATVNLELLRASKIKITDLITIVLPDSSKTNVRITKMDKDIMRVATEVAKVY
ncbi:PTS transporter subunit IIABC [Mycoplasma crocodyli]|uniref:PTS system, glucose-specific, IICBA component n=1 Tax=Mycoplasma crocodyli (strain ATCC 51981 / MP145) TaxID=512564 RepID=D5E602_MYCCM|nr:PTS transporter subunit IIABC [Mycoplasma crocodyli]ADE19812.1 PTS system, glucose-specific, IICBA component [Mycoplasma crocodyli MP145]